MNFNLRTNQTISLALKIRPLSINQYSKHVRPDIHVYLSFSPCRRNGGGGLILIETALWVDLLDVEGTFDRTPIKSIIDTGEDHALSAMIINWIVSMLKPRLVTGAKAGSPQGGVLWPLQWFVIIHPLTTWQHATAAISVITGFWKMYGLVCWSAHEQVLKGGGRSLVTVSGRHAPSEKASSLSGETLGVEDTTRTNRKNLVF